MRKIGFFKSTVSKPNTMTEKPAMRGNSATLLSRTYATIKATKVSATKSAVAGIKPRSSEEMKNTKIGPNSVPQLNMMFLRRMYLFND